ncbi:hypothetical protein GPECTOR_31g353 [Gonium pectorale]|uniref:Uncharacterized protein n=1 Tax=Gonium pectorale TaxID=33097 RepID=A0A150GF86_GONPE|nr:hypothetical protein GPECTOR_31g353 [Gonium pectorale]|eukprot:KXZ47990.1 hypothetical protein GPECTOR_31g353 [Gonium pectorale]
MEAAEEGGRAARGKSSSPRSSLHDRLAAERHVPRPVPSLGLEDAAALDDAAVAAAAGVSSDEAERLRREAQDEVLSELKGEVLQRRASTGEEAGKQPPAGHRPSEGAEGALLKFARAAARERHDTVRHVLQSVPPAHVDLDELDRKNDGGEDADADAD